MQRSGSRPRFLIHLFACGHLFMASVPENSGRKYTLYFLLSRSCARQSRRQSHGQRRRRVSVNPAKVQQRRKKIFPNQVLPSFTGGATLITPICPIRSKSILMSPPPFKASKQLIQIKTKRKNTDPELSSNQALGGRSIFLRFYRCNETKKKGREEQ